MSIKDKLYRAEQETDSFLAKLQANPYTVIIVAAAAIGVLVLWVLIG